MQGDGDGHEGRAGGGEAVRRALLVGVLLAATAAIAQPVAKVEPVRTQHQKLDLILQDLAAIKALLSAPRTPPSFPPTTPPATPTPTPKPPPSSSGIDYSRFAGMTPQEIMSPFGPFQGRGLPGGWSWEEAFAAGVLNPDAAPRPPSTGPAPGGANIDAPSFDWSDTGKWLRVIAPASKTVTVPAGYNGLVRFEIAKMAGSTADFVRVTVLDGGAVVAQDPMIAAAGGKISFVARGGKTYVLLVEGAGAVVSVNLLIGG